MSEKVSRVDFKERLTSKLEAQRAENLSQRLDLCLPVKILEAASLVLEGDEKIPWIWTRSFACSV